MNIYQFLGSAFGFGFKLGGFKGSTLDSLYLSNFSSKLMTKSGYLNARLLISKGSSLILNRNIFSLLLVLNAFLSLSCCSCGLGYQLSKIPAQPFINFQSPSLFII